MTSDYIWRNIQVATAFGVAEGLKSAANRLHRQKRPPKWLVRELLSLEKQAFLLIEPLIAYREEVSPWKKKPVS